MNLVLKNLQRDKITKVLTILMTHIGSYSRVYMIREWCLRYGFSGCMSQYELGMISEARYI